MCPKCGSTHVKIKQAKGVERILMFWTGKRKYRCQNCFNLFRDRDRRRTYRSEESKTPTPVLTVAGESAGNEENR
jgi:transposase-like protein